MLRKLFNIPELASSHAAEMDRMLNLVHIFMLILFVGWSLFFIIALIRFRRSRNPKANYYGVQHYFSNYIEAGVVIIEAILLLGFAFPIWAKVVEAFPDPKKSTLVDVIAEQFTWNFHYPGPDGKFGRRDIKLLSTQNPIGLDSNDPAAKDDIITLNQLHLPVNKPVILHITSKDVVHSFKIYEMRVNQDATPGLRVPVWFIPVKTGQYEIVCAQLCGLGHYRMRGFMTVHTPEDYEKWVKEQKEAAKGEEW